MTLEPNRRSRIHRLRLTPNGMVLCALLGGLGFWGTAKAADLLRGGSSSAGAAQPALAPATNLSAAAANALPSPQDRLKVTTNVLQAVQRLQAQARASSLAAAQVRPPVSDGLTLGGLQVAAGVPRDLLHPQSGEDPTLWSGASLPTASSSNANDITISQTQQQAVLNWQTFNIGSQTSLTFDQSKGGADAPTWIAFNKIGVTGTPSQIFGSLRSIGPDGTPATGGQIYLINPNGIIFGGTAQVNTHALVASSLPINDNLIARGLLSDNQFLFSALPQAVGINGAPATSAPAFSDPSFTIKNTVSGAYVLNRVPSDPTKVAVSYRATDGTVTTLALTTDYTVSQTSDGTAQVVFSSDALARLNPSAGALPSLTVSYPLRSDQYGDVAVFPGAQLGDVSGVTKGTRVALVGPNVSNLGTITTPEGQTILAAGLQVGFAAHPSNDASVRGLDVYVGQVAASDVTSTTPYTGTASNDSIATGDGGFYQGLISAPRGNVTITGSTVNQLGFIDSQTSVSLNGSVNLSADYNAYPNLGYDSGAVGDRLFLYPDATVGPATGLVTFGAESVTRITISDSTTDTTNSTPSAGLPLASQVNVHGQAILFAADPSDSLSPSAAILLAPNASVNLVAGTWGLVTGSGSGKQDVPLADSGQIYLDRGTVVDVGGTQGAQAPITENIVPVQLRGSELADSPLQRDGALRGQTINVDIRQHSGVWDPTLDNGNGNFTWVGTPLIPESDISGYLNLVQRNAGELSVNGGTVNLQAGGSVVLQPGSSINVSGGWTNFTGGTVATTKVVSGGRVYDISQAPSNLVYTGIYNGIQSTTDAKWGVTTSTVNPALGGDFYDPGYLQGGQGGTVKIAAPEMALDGTLTGPTYAGPNQTLTAPKTGSAVSVPMGTAQLMPIGSALTLTFQAETIDNALPVTYSPTPPNVVLGAGSTLAKDSPVADFSVDPTSKYMLDTARQDEVDLSPDALTANGFGRLSIDNSDDHLGTNGRSDPSADFGRITVAANSDDPTLPAFTLPANGALSLTAANIDLFGGITAPSGSLSFSAVNVSQSQLQQLGLAGPPEVANDNRGTLTIGKNVAFDVSGQAINALKTNASSPQDISGGSVSFTGYNVIVGDGTSINVSGGAVLASNGKVTYGSAGKISISGGFEGLLADGVVTLPTSWLGDTKTSAVSLSGFAGTGGGELDLTAPLLQIGGDSVPEAGTLISPELFSRGGFSTFTLNGVTSLLNPDLPALSISAGTKIAPTVTNWVANTQIDGATPLTFDLYTPVANLQPAVGLTLNAQHVPSTSTTSGVGRADLFLDQSVSISLDANSADKVTLSGDTVTVLGQVSAPGGTIQVSSKAGSSTTLFADQTDALATVYLGPESILSTAGQFVATPNAQGYQTGNALKGGKINVSGNIVAEKGAILDVSGTSATVDVPPTQASPIAQTNASTHGQIRVQQTLDSDGGTLTLSGSQELFTDATLLGNAGGASAVGGTLNIASGIFDPTALNPVNIAALQITQNQLTIPVPFFDNGETAIGQTVVDKTGKILGLVDPASGTNFFGGYFSINRFASGGFDSLNLAGRIQFSGPVSIKARNSVSLAGSSGSIMGGILLADPGAVQKSSLTVSAPSIAIGQTLTAPSTTAQSIFPQSFAPVNDTATIKINATNLIDIGNLSLQNIGTATFNASSGDIRGDGTLDVAGDIKLSAGQIYPPTATVFNIVAYDYTKNGATVPGSVTLTQIGVPGQFPLSAGGQLNIFASTINQGATLRAPMGTINLGAGTDANAPQTDPISGLTFALTQSLTLSKTSVTSVSAIDPATGLAMMLPYGINVGGDAWIDPTGTDISLGDPRGKIGKTVTLTASKIDDQTGSKIDISGGGDLYAYRFVPGTGGSNDVLSSTTANTYAVIPNYSATYAPYGGYASGVTTLGGDTGYTSSTGLAAGDRVTLAPGSGLPAGTYTLLPARYALLPGAFLVTELGTVVNGQGAQPDGSSLVGGYRSNTSNSSRVVNPSYDTWQVSPSAVTRTLAEYDDFTASAFFTASTAAQSVATPRLPDDAGHLILDASSALTLNGTVSSAALKNADGTSSGRGGIVDIDSPLDVLIAGPNATLTAAQKKALLVLDAAQLDAFGAESLLIGGIRQETTTGTAISVRTNNIEVDNGAKTDQTGQVLKAGVPLTGSDIVLVANDGLILAPGADIEQGGVLAGKADALTVVGNQSLMPGASANFIRGGVAITFPQGTGSSTLTASVDVTLPGATGPQTIAAGTPITVAAGGTLTLSAPGALNVAANTADTPQSAVPIQLGDGVLLRISSDPSAVSTRSNVAGFDIPALTIGARAILNGGSGSLTFDSTAATALDPTAVLTGNTVNLGSGQISLALNGTTGTPGGLVLTGNALKSLEQAASLSLFSYSTIDLYGSGTVGDSSVAQLSLHSSGIRSGQSNTEMTFLAANIMVDNPLGTTLTPTQSDLDGSLTFSASQSLQIGSSQSNAGLLVDGFRSVQLSASGQSVGSASKLNPGLNLVGTGGLTTAGDLSIDTPLITATAGANQQMIAGGTVNVENDKGATSTASSLGLGAQLLIKGSSLSLGANTHLRLPTGSIQLEATSGDISLAGALDVSGTTEVFNDVSRFTGGGQINLLADAGNIAVLHGASLSVAADNSTLLSQSTADAGLLLVSAPAGSFSFADHTLQGPAGNGGAGGQFVVDLRTLAGGANASAGNSLSALDLALNAGGFTQLRSYRFRSGDVAIDGQATAKTYAVSADTGTITVTGQIDASGEHGGSVDLSAAGSVVVAPHAVVDVSGKNYDDAGKGGAVMLSAGANQSQPADNLRDATSNQFSAGVPVVDIKSGSNLDFSIGLPVLAVPAGTSVTLASGTPHGDQVAVSVNGVVSATAGGTVTSNGVTSTFGPGANMKFNAGSVLTIFGSGTITTASGSGELTLVGNGAGGSLPVTMADGSVIRLNPSDPAALVAAAAADAATGKTTGTLQIRAPQTAAGFDTSGNLISPPDVQVNPIAGTLKQASSVVVEGYRTFSTIGGYIDSVESDVDQNGQLFASPANSTALGQILKGSGTDWSNTSFHLRPGAEIVGTAGNGTPSTFTFTNSGAGSTLQVPAASEIDFPDLSQSLSSNDQIKFSSAVSLNAADAGYYSFAASLNSTSTTGASVNVDGQSSFLLTRGVNDGALQSTANATATLSDGSQQTIAANTPFPALPTGATVTFEGSGRLTSLVGSAGGTLTEQFLPGTVAVPANATVAMPIKGGSVVFAKAGTMTYTTGTNALPLQLLGNASFASGTNPATLTPATGTNLSLTSTRSYLLVGNNGVFALPAGVPSAGLQISPTDVAATETDVDFTSVSGASISASGGGSIQTKRGGSMIQTGLSLDQTGVDISPLGGSITFTTEGMIVSSGPGVVTFTDGTPSQTLTPGQAIDLKPGATLSFAAGNAATHVATSDGSIATISLANNFAAGLTSFVAGESIVLGNTPDQVMIKAMGILTVTNSGPLVITPLQDSKVAPLGTSSSGLLVALQGGTSYTTAGATVLNSSGQGDLTLASTWDLSSFRYGANGTEPGVLTLRAPGNLVLNANASLSDGFGAAAGTGATNLWQAPLLPAGEQSWTYHLTAGADLSAANVQQVLALSQLAPSSGSVLLGANSQPINTAPNASRQNAVLANYQTIRTGTGDILISAGRDLQMLNDLATIYTAGTQVTDPTHLEAANTAPADFDLPITFYNGGTATNETPFGGPQYTYGGGNLTINVQNNIEHLSAQTGLDTSSKELPNNWLYRSGAVDPNGNFAVLSTPSPVANTANPTEVASTSWWVDFSNFFEGVGALGGGNVVLKAGNSVKNVDAVVPTNARATKYIGSATTPDFLAADQHLYELGGGDLTVTAGKDISGGVYYVENGNGSFSAGGAILTNSTRNTLTQAQVATLHGAVPDPTTWMPTTFFLGNGSLAISATGDALIGSVVNPFLLPQGINNSLYQRTFFSTYGADDSVSVSSLTGDVTLANILTPTTQISSGGYGSLGSFIQNIDTASSYASAQPWLHLIETNLTAFSTVVALEPPAIEATSFSGDIKLVGELTLSPSSNGTLDLIAAKSIEGFLPNNPQNAAAALSSSNLLDWEPSLIDLSDADPQAIPGILDPGAVISDPNSVKVDATVAASVLRPINALFTESGATLGENVVLQTKEALHGKSNEAANGTSALHNDDDQPARLYAGSGDISGLTLFSPKATSVIAGQDITDIGFYLQNASADSVSVVSAGRDILAYDLNSGLRQAALKSRGVTNPNLQSAGDIQISGPGTLEVLAGRNIALGPIPQNPANDGTQAGITSIGNLRNPNLPFQGADLFVAAGLGTASPQLSTSGVPLNFTDSALLSNPSVKNPSGFIDQFIDPVTGNASTARHLPELGQLLGFTVDDKNPEAQNPAIWSAFEKLSPSDQARYAMEMFYIVLRDAGRDHNNRAAAGFGNYNEGYEAIASLFESRLDFNDAKSQGFVDVFLNPANPTGQANTYLPKLAVLLGQSGATSDQTWSAFTALSSDQQHRLALAVFDEVLTDAAQEQNAVATAASGKSLINQAISSFFAGQSWQGDISLTSRDIRTTNGGNINIFAPGGGIALGTTLPPTPLNSSSKTGLPPPGIVTDSGGDINIFTHTDVDVGVARIFTLRGGNEVIWSTTGNIAAGKSSKTVQTAPPTQVLIDPQSGNVETDLSGLATGGGIGVLASVAGVAPGNVDLIAPVGTVDAGDAGIRSTGNLNIAARVVLNASNIQVGGISSGTPVAPAAPNIASLASAAATSASATSAAEELSKQNTAPAEAQTAVPSLIDVEVTGYGGDDSDDTTGQFPAQNLSF